MRKLLLLLLLFSTGYLSQAQEQHAYIKDLSAEQVGNKILVRWTTKAGFSCQDIGVELSTDSMNYLNRATFYGLCGDTAEKQYNLFVEGELSNGIHYIRLNLGSYGYSYDIALKYIQFQSSSVSPNPINTASYLYFRNPLQEKIIIKITHYNGTAIKEIETSSDKLHLLEHISSRGIYFYTVEQNASLLTRGKFVY